MQWKLLCAGGKNCNGKLIIAVVNDLLASVLDSLENNICTNLFALKAKFLEDIENIKVY